VINVSGRCWDGWISETAGSCGQRVGTVVDVNVSIIEVGGVKPIASRVAAIRKTGINVTGVAGSDDAGGPVWTSARVPANDVARDGCEYESCWAGCDRTRRDGEIGRSFADNSSWEPSRYRNCR
jgi:hypothetical protein